MYMINATVLQMYMCTCHYLCYYQDWRNHCGRLLVGPMVLSGLEEPPRQVTGRAYGPIRTVRNHCGRLLVGPMVLSGLEEPPRQVTGRAYGPIRTVRNHRGRLLVGPMVLSRLEGYW